jgi:chromosome segregation ATPase
MARTVVYVQEHGYDTREDLLHYQAEISGKLDTASSSLSETASKLKEINERIHYTGQYYASRSVQSGFLNSGNKKTFREAHRTELDQYNEAVRYFKENAGGKVPSMIALKAEKDNLQHTIEKQKTLLASLRQEQKELQTAASNIEAILGDTSVQRKEKRKTEPEL